MTEPLRVWSACTYPGSDLAGERGIFLQDTWHAEKFIKAVKGDDLKAGYADVPVPIGGQRRRLTKTNQGEVFLWFGEMIAAQFRFPEARRFLLVPVPPHRGTAAAIIRQSSIWRLAEAVAAKNESCAATVGIVWKNEMKSARKGGPRNIETLQPNCVTTTAIKRRADVILLDDVITTGGHLAACATQLRNAGASVMTAFCVGRTVSSQAAAPFSWDERLMNLR